MVSLTKSTAQFAMTVRQRYEVWDNTPQQSFLVLKQPCLLRYKKRPREAQAQGLQRIAVSPPSLNSEQPLSLYQQSANLYRVLRIT